MKFGHASALALAGWYLMLPAPNLPLADRAPFANWNHDSSYDTAKECEQAKRELYAEIKEKGFQMKPYSTAGVKRSFQSAECIEVDDPRLKSK